jgi:uncharacterized protein (TIGR02596 family)
VLVIIAVVAAMTLEGYSKTMQATSVTTGADMLKDALTEGRADAVAQNATVEVRIYERSTEAGGAPVYNALQLHWIKADGTTPPVAHPILLPVWVVIDATPVHSPLIASNPQTAEADGADRYLNADTRVFHFLPDGSTDLNPGTNWFMTLRPATQSDPDHFPSNWACIAVDATTGRSQIYRP